MTEELQKPEEPTDAPAAEEKAVVKAENGEALPPITIEQIKAEATAFVERVKEAGFNPLRILGATYLEKIKGAADGFARGLEGRK